jgi:transcription antitermination factor NusG
MDESKWFIISTKQGEEKKLADQLSNKGIKSFCPLNKLNQRWRERKHIYYRPLFAGYVFVNAVEKNIPVIKKLPGVTGLVFWLDGFAEVPAEEIAAISNFLDEYSGIKLEKTPVNKSDHVRIIYGPLVVREGEAFEVRNSPVSVTLPSLGFVLVAQERKRQPVNVSIQPRYWQWQKKVS